ncbi:MAG: hypothetical protein CMP43_01255 [Rickettsiales bacterium]|nr:hypothetical protein [Rickettsiales bacterium]|tara:strand:- start:1495 stop:2019 length:525 start_codon:yes stop_codon:yes gene_type:complete
MKNFKLKVSIIFFSYVILIALIILSYISIVPNEELIILENQRSIIKKVENNFQNNEEGIYQILEKDKPKNIDELIEEKLEEKDQSLSLNEKKEYRLQLASFRNYKKSEKISKQIIQNDFFKKNKINLKIKEFNLEKNNTYFRVVSENVFSYREANSNCKILKKNKINCIVLKDN